MSGQSEPSDEPGSGRASERLVVALVRGVHGLRGAVRVEVLTDHPETNDRAIAIEAMASSTPRRPLLNQTEWAALKAICEER